MIKIIEIKTAIYNEYDIGSTLIWECYINDYNKKKCNCLFRIYLSEILIGKIK